MFRDSQGPQPEHWLTDSSVVNQCEMLVGRSSARRRGENHGLKSLVRILLYTDACFGTYQASEGGESAPTAKRRFVLGFSCFLQRHNDSTKEEISDRDRVVYVDAWDQRVLRT